MAITAMGLGTKAAPAGANLDPQSQFWSFLSAFCGEQVTTTTGSDEWSNRAWFSGFKARANDPTDMSVLIGGENGTTDSAALWHAGPVVLLSTDGQPQKVTIQAAPAAGARYDAIVSYIDKSNADAETEKPGTPDYVKTIVVSGTAASSPNKPTDSQIKAKLPAGVGSYFRWCDVYVESGATDINDSNITDARPASPNVYYAPQIEHTTISWYGCTLDLRKYGKVVTLTCGQPLTIQVPKQGSEPGKIPEGWRPYEGIGISILFDLYPDFAGRINIGANGNWDWFATGGMNPNLYPTINATWMTP